MSKIYSLAYISKNAIRGDRSDIEAEIKSILSSARKNNPALGVTGALLYSGGYFCQVIEGAEAVLEELFENIQLDARHGHVTVLHFQPIKERNFGDWAMAFAGIDDEMRFETEGLLDSKDKIKAEEAGRHLVSTLDTLVRQHQGVLIDQNRQGRLSI